MKKRLISFLLILVAVCASVSLSSCNKEDEVLNGTGNYYVQLWNLETNLCDAEGNSLKLALKEEWIKTVKADKQGRVAIGKMNKENAKKFFNDFVEETIRSGNETYAGKNILPEGGWILYSFVLDSDASYGGAQENVIIEISNSGAKKH